MTTASFIYAGLAALAAGAINAIAGGGSLVTFPTLVAIGLSPITASITNTIALCPGYLGATIAQREDLVGQRRRVVMLAPVGALAGFAGGQLLLVTDAHAFDIAVPFLLLFAALLVGAQDRIRDWLFGREHGRRSEMWAMLPVALGGVYGGYFGAGLGVIVLAALGIVLSDTLVRINALKQTVSLVVNVSAAAFLAFSGRVDWPIAGVMFACALAGGLLGGKLATMIPASLLRWSIVVLGITLSVVYFLRLSS